MRRSSDTDGSPPSIFATRDWLDRMSLARAAWLRFCFFRRLFRLSARRRRSSTYAASSSESPKNSWALPIRQPFFSSSLFLLRRIIVFLEPLTTRLQHALRGLRRLLREDIRDHDRVRIHPIDDPPGVSLVGYPQLVASAANRRHGPRVRHPQALAPLQLPEQVARFQTCCLAEWGCLHLTMEPRQRLVPPTHRFHYMSDQTSPQANKGMKLSKPGDLGGGWPQRRGITKGRRNNKSSRVIATMPPR